jgi:hypothetical protein
MLSIYQKNSQFITNTSLYPPQTNQNPPEKPPTTIVQISKSNTRYFLKYYPLTKISNISKNTQYKNPINNAQEITKLHLQETIPNSSSHLTLPQHISIPV